MSAQVQQQHGKFVGSLCGKTESLSIFSKCDMRKTVWVLRKLTLANMYFINNRCVVHVSTTNTHTHGGGGGGWRRQTMCHKGEDEDLTDTTALKRQTGCDVVNNTHC